MAGKQVVAAGTRIGGQYSAKVHPEVNRTRPQVAAASQGGRK